MPNEPNLRDLVGSIGALRSPAPPIFVDTDHVKWFKERIEIQAKEFREKLPPEAAILATVVLPGGREITAHWFGYHGPDMLVVRGVDGQGRDCRVLVAHQSVHIVLTAVTGPDTKAVRPIGFQSTRDETKSGAEAPDGDPVP